MGAEILEEYGWVSTRTPLGQTTGLCLPNDISRFAYIEPWSRHNVDSGVPPLPALSGLEGDVMHMISNLSNYVLAAGAMNNLKRVRNRHPRMFSSTTLFHRAMRAVSTNHFQAPVRRFILDLFDVELGPHTLPRLTHLEKGSYAYAFLKEKGEACNDEDCKDDEPDEDDNDVEADTRRRARSSPGPEPSRTSGLRRSRGLTVNDLTPSRVPTAPVPMDPLDPLSPSDSSPLGSPPHRPWAALYAGSSSGPSTPTAQERNGGEDTPPTIRPPPTKPSALAATASVANSATVSHNGRDGINGE